MMNRRPIAVFLAVISAVSLGAFIFQARAPTGPRPPEPYMKYLFLVEIDGITQASFLEVDGLNVTVDVIEYREGSDPNNPILVPGLVHYGPLVLRNGVTANNELLNWMEDVTAGSFTRKNLSIVLLDPDGSEIARYNLWGAWPSHWNLGKLNALGLGPVIEELVVQYEGFERVTSAG
jgi:phage tail-like protein